jgi:exodeoxyribonuclease VII large subunit
MDGSEGLGFSVAGREIVYGVSDFVAVINQVIEYTMPTVLITGELANFKVSKGKWVYFDLKDEESSVRFFGTVFMLPGPLEDGMLLEVRGSPRLHERFGFSVNVQTIRPVGEGSLRKAAQLLEAKLAAEGLFDDDRKRELEYPPARIGLVTSGESAAYVDFMKILSDRWSGVHILLADVQVQGERSPAQVVAAIQWFNSMADPPDVLVVIRGGGSADDLAAFSDERVVRAVAASRVPTLVAIGHEIDVSLAELAADRRGATPSNAAEILVPERREVLRELANMRMQLADDWYERLDTMRQELADIADDAYDAVTRLLERQRADLAAQRKLASALDPAVALARGFAIVRGADGRVIRHASQVAANDIVRIGISDAELTARVDTIKRK